MYDSEALEKEFANRRDILELIAEVRRLREENEILRMSQTLDVPAQTLKDNREFIAEQMRRLMNLKPEKP
jgi:hypothetical protein